MDSGSIVQLVVLIILLVLSAFFSSAETALTTVNKIKLKAMEEEGNSRAKLVLKITENSHKMLSAILIGNNIVNLSASSLATVFATKLFGSVGAGVATGVLTAVVLIFGEISPKTVATIKALKISLAYCKVIYALMVVLTPIIYVINALSRGFLLLFGIDSSKVDDTVTEDEIKIMVDASHESGEIEVEEKEYIHNIFDFTDSCAKEIMIPRVDMTMVSVDSTYDELMDIYKEDKFTRLPVFEEDNDNIIGLLNMKDMLLAEREGFSIKKYLREVYFTYEQKNTSELFEEMRRERLSQAIVLDEYGAVAGLVTLEDLLEELVGEIRDEFDEREEDDIVEIGPREFIVLGSTNLDDLYEELDIDTEEEDAQDYDTIGGYITGQLNHIPEVGESCVTDNGIQLTVEEVEKKRVTRIRMVLPEITEDESIDEESGKHFHNQ
ncbi:MAG: hemolysin family protein [Lachnospiraceae bacterium]|nr:hemolysin family protein [Lachnospiraceae bacterium]